MKLYAIRADLMKAMTALGYEVYDHVPEVIEPPAAVVALPDHIAYATNYADGTRLEIGIVVIVARADARDAERRLAAAVSTAADPEVSTRPLRPALHAFKSPHWKSLVVTRADGFGEYELGVGRNGLGAVLNLDINT